MTETQQEVVLGRNHEDVVAVMIGNLKKWTNYILGWKTRFFVLKQGHLLYYKSSDDVHYGCRGAINLQNANLVPHEFDECRFDLHFCDMFWYLRADSGSERRKWIEVLSLYTSFPKSASQSNRWVVSENIRKIAAYKDLIVRQLMPVVETHNVIMSSQDCQSGVNITTKEHKVDVSQCFPTTKTDLITFNVTVDELISSITHCLDMMEERERSWIILNNSRNLSGCTKDMLTAGPEMAEGENCLLRDEEFYDAVESELERIEEEAELRKRLEDSSVNEVVSCEKTSQHPLWIEIERATEEQVRLTCSEMSEDWSLLVEGENMKMFTRELELDGIVMDPLKAVCTVKGVTAREICHYFYHPQYRKDWEMTLEQMRVVEKIGDDTMIFHQVYKRIWPAAQRDILFWSRLSRRGSPGGHDVWTVVNKSIDLPQIPANDGKYVRVTLALCLYCVTETRRGAGEITRDDITCHLTYCSTVNPGGWVPASAIRALSRKEYPKFLNKFTSYVVKQTRDKKIVL